MSNPGFFKILVYGSSPPVRGILTALLSPERYDKQCWLFYIHVYGSPPPPTPLSVKRNLLHFDLSRSSGYLMLACNAGVFFLPLPLPRYFSFQPNSHSLGRIFVSLQASSEFESKMALAWSNSQPRTPKYACIAGYAWASLAASYCHEFCTIVMRAGK